MSLSKASRLRKQFVPECLWLRFCRKYNIHNGSNGRLKTGVTGFDPRGNRFAPETDSKQVKYGIVI